MSAEALRFLASAHGTPIAPSPHNAFLSPGQHPRTSDGGGLGPLVPATLPPMPPHGAQSLADHFRPLPPGLQHISFYPPCLGGPGLSLDLKNDPLSGALTHGQPILPPPFYYDPCFSAAYNPYHDRFGGPLDINGTRRKNATRETTAALKAWLYEHRKNPYPTKGEKVMLAIITKMTLTQVSTWFANARRRLKKENKMTWSPRNRSGEEEDDDDDERRDGHHNQTGVDSSERPLSSQSSLLDMNDFSSSDNEANDKAVISGHIVAPLIANGRASDQSSSSNPHSIAVRSSGSAALSHLADYADRPLDKRCRDESSDKAPDQPTSSPSKKPKIWSIAETVNLSDADNAPTASASSFSDSFKPGPVAINENRPPNGANSLSLHSHNTSTAAPPLPSAAAAAVAAAGPFNFTFPPFNLSHLAAAMSPRAAHFAAIAGLSLPGSPLQPQAPPQPQPPPPPFFGLSPATAAMMMMPRPELFYRNFLMPLHHQQQQQQQHHHHQHHYNQQSPLNMAAMSMATSANSAHPFNLYQAPTAGTVPHCATNSTTNSKTENGKEAMPSQPAISNASAVVSPISSISSTRSSSPHRNVTSEIRNHSK